MRLIFITRPLIFWTLRNWYSTYRWHHPYKHDGNEVARIIDIGGISIGYGKK